MYNAVLVEVLFSQGVKAHLHGADSRNEHRDKVTHRVGRALEGIAKLGLQQLLTALLVLALSLELLPQSSSGRLLSNQLDLAPLQGSFSLISLQQRATSVGTPTIV